MELQQWCVCDTCVYLDSLGALTYQLKSDKRAWVIQYELAMKVPPVNRPGMVSYDLGVVSTG